jgi:hypothetical protein
MKRLFTFGCSFTKWTWPTWADILAKNQSYDLYENWGQSGAGNLFIFNSIIECNLRHKFTKNDTVRVMWSTTHRMDHYRDQKWKLCGGIQSVQALKIGPFDLRGYYIRDLAFIHAIDQLMSSVGCDFVMMSMTSLIDDWASAAENSMLQNPEFLSLKQEIDDCRDIVGLYQETLNKIYPSIHKVVYDHDWTSRPQHAKNDFHPGPLLHLEYLDKILGDGYISTDTRNIVNEWNKLHVRLNDSLCDWSMPGSHKPVRF